MKPSSVPVAAIWWCCWCWCCSCCLGCCCYHCAHVCYYFLTGPKGLILPNFGVCVCITVCSVLCEFVSGLGLLILECLCQDWVCWFWSVCVRTGFVDFGVFVSGLGLLILECLWFDDLCEEWLGDRLKFVFSPDIILCSWPGSKYRLTNELAIYFSSELYSTLI